MTTAPDDRQMSAPGPPTASPIASTSTRKRRVWPLVTIAVVLVVLIVGFFVGDAAAKSYAQDRIRQQIVSGLGLPANTEVDVRVGGGSVLVQALSGRLSVVDVRIPKLAFGALQGAATLHATDLPLDRSQPVKTLGITYTVSQKDVTALASTLSGVKLDSIVLQHQQIVATATLSASYITVPVGLSLTPSTHDGHLAFTPDSVTVSGQSFTAAQLEANPLFGSIARTLLKQQSFCVAQYLPKAVTMSSAQVRGTNLVLAFSGDGAVLDGPAFSTKGSCS